MCSSDLRCKKTYEDYVGDDNLVDNNIDPSKYDGGVYPLFQEGKEYKFSGPVGTLSGKDIMMVEAELLDYKGKPMFERFYMNEYDPKKLKEWEEKWEKYKGTEHEELIMDMKDRYKNEPYIKDYFEYED